MQNQANPPQNNIFSITIKNNNQNLYNLFVTNVFSVKYKMGRQKFNAREGQKNGRPCFADPENSLKLKWLRVNRKCSSLR